MFEEASGVPRTQRDGGGISKIIASTDRLIPTLGIINVSRGQTHNGLSGSAGPRQTRHSDSSGSLRPSSTGAATSSAEGLSASSRLPRLLGAVISMFILARLEVKTLSL